MIRLHSIQRGFNLENMVNENIKKNYIFLKWIKNSRNVNNVDFRVY